MGMFDFVKSAGEKIISSAADAAGAILGHVNKEMPEAKDKVQVQYNDGTATVTGQAASQEEKEKIILAAGNVNGVGKVNDNITVAGAHPADQSRMYTVKSGDTLSKIAKDMYGNAGDYPKIFKANQPLLKDPDKIYPGQMLRIP